MRERLQNLVMGNITEYKKSLEISVESLKFTAIEEQIYHGSFKLSALKNQKVRGLISTNSKHITLTPQEFSANSITVTFDYDAASMSEGDVEDSYIVILSDAGEFKIPVHVEISRLYNMSSIGKIKTLNDFTNLAKLNWQEALKIFRLPNFKNIFHDKDIYEMLLFDGITANGKTSLAMEEFLIGVDKKQRNDFHADNSDVTYTVKKDRVQFETLKLRKSGWGYTEFDITSDSPFVNIDQKHVTYDEFTGNHADIEFEVVPQKMHKGINPARIKISNAFNTEEINITARYTAPITEKSYKSSLRINLVKLEHYYLDAMSGRIDKKIWITKSFALVEKLLKAEPENDWYKMLLIYFMLMRNNDDNAFSIVELSKDVKKKNDPRTAFYLYLTTITNQDRDYLMSTAEKIRDINRTYRNHPVPVWCQIKLLEALKRSDERRYELIKTYCDKYSNSPIFYFEAAQILIKHPELLFMNDDFDMKMAIKMGRNGDLTKEIANKILQASETMKYFDQIYFDLMETCYRVADGESALKAICVYLINLNRYGTEYLKWFDLGIKKHLRVAGLYEAFMMCWSPERGPLPNEVIKYFSMNSSISSRKKALLFAYIIKNKTRINADWDKYSDQIFTFAKTELSKGHMNDDLAVIYEELKRSSTLEEWATYKDLISASYKIDIPYENIVGVRVFQKGDSKIQRVPVFKNSCFIELRNKPYVIIYEDSAGNLYNAKGHFRLTKMISGNNVFNEFDIDLEYRKKTEQFVMSQEEMLAEFAGTSEDLIDAYDEFIKYNEENHEYAEVILARMIFSDTFSGDHNRLFKDVCKYSRDKLVCDAYASIMAYRYVCHNIKISEDVVSYMAEFLANGRNINRYCRYAILKYFVETEDVNIKDYALKILSKNLRNGIYLDFYKNLPQSILRKYMITGCDIISVEYKGDSDLKVVWVEDKKAYTGYLKRVYADTFTTRVDRLTAREVPYIIYDRNDEAVAEGRLPAVSVGSKDDDSRWGRIVKIDKTGSVKDMQEFAECADMVRLLFKPIEE